VSLSVRKGVMEKSNIRTDLLPNRFFILLLTIISGLIFYYFQDLIQSAITSADNGTVRCRNILYDRGQPIRAICAGLACFLYARKISSARGYNKRLFVDAFLYSGLSFFFYFVWLSKYIITRSECSALYSPGPIGILGFPIVGIVLLFEWSLWALACSIMVLLLIRPFFDKSENYD